MFDFKRKKIDWFLIFFLFFALVVIFLFAFFLNNFLTKINKKSDLKKDSQAIISQEEIKSDYLSYLVSLEKDLDSFYKKEDPSLNTEEFLEKTENSFFSVKVPNEYRDFHFKLALLFSKIKFELNNNKDLSTDLLDLIALIDFEIYKK